MAFRDSASFLQRFLNRVFSAVTDVYLADTLEEEVQGKEGAGGRTLEEESRLAAPEAQITPEHGGIQRIVWTMAGYKEPVAHHDTHARTAFCCSCRARLRD